ncbi:hypothetical protein BT69DRAFT_1352717 [Atractiella rhizophila]|nr:hypothetical protein BT69DRAFT_1352717 [Atractiella rhizophila]
MSTMRADYRNPVTPTRKRKAAEAFNPSTSSDADEYTSLPQYGAIKFGEFGKYMDNKKAKLRVQLSDLQAEVDQGLEGEVEDEFLELLKGTSQSEILRGCKIWIDGAVFSPPQIVLRKIIALHGGEYVAYLDAKRSVTHIIATTLTPSKVKEYATFKVNGGRGVDRVLGSAIGLDTEGWGRETSQQTLSFASTSAPPKGIPPMSKLRIHLSPDPDFPAPNSSSDHITPIPLQKGTNDEASTSNSSPSDQFPRQSKLPPNRPPPRFALDVAGDSDPGVSARTLGAIEEETEEEASDIPPAAQPVRALQEIEQSSDTSFVLPPHVLDQVPLTSSPLPSPPKPPPAPPISPIKSISPRKRGQVGPEGNNDGWEPPQRVGKGREGVLLESEEWRKTHTSANAGGYVEQFLNQSRLHLISTLKLELQDYVAKKLKEKERDGVKTKEKEKEKKKWRGTEGEGRWFAHVDLDCFFVSAGLTKRPELKGKPVAVCHVKGQGKGGKDDPSTSEIASCSYEARKFGVRNGMFLGRARELCPDIQTIPYDFELYKRISYTFYDLLLERSVPIQAQSLDEAYIDISTLIDMDPRTLSQTSAIEARLQDFGNSLRQNIFEATGCTASLGLGENMLLSRLATKKAKPDGVYWLRVGAGREVSALGEKEIEGKEWLDGLDVRDLPGVGRESEKKLEAIGVEKVRDLKAVDRQKLVGNLGQALASKLLDYAKGVDNKELEDPGKMRKSVSTEINYGIRFKTEQETKTFVENVAADTAKRLQDASLKGRHLTIKVMVRAPDAPIEPTKFMGHGVCDAFSKSMPISDGKGGPTDEATVLGEGAWKMLKASSVPWEDLRGFSIMVTKLEGTTEGNSSQKKLDFGSMVTKPGAEKKGKEKEKGLRRVSELIPADEDWRNLDTAASSSKATLVGPPPGCQPTQLDFPDREMIEDDDFLALPSEYQRAIMSKGVTLPRSKSPSFIDLPGYGKIAQDDFDALPKDIQRELKRTYRERTPAAIPSKRGRSATNSDAEDDGKVAKKKQKVVKLEPGQLKLIDQRVKKNDKHKYTKGITREVVLGGTTSKVSPAPSPSAITDEELRVLGLDADYFRCIPRADQIDTLRYQKASLRREWKVFKEQKEQRNKAAAKERRKFLDFEKPDGPKLQGKETIEELRDLLESWFDNAREKPARDDVRDVREFLLASLNPQTGRGRDWEKVAQVLKWWKLLLGDASKDETNEENIRAWEKAYDRTKRHVELVSKEVFDCVLKI